MILLHLALDDTDSHKGGCTTYVAGRLLKYLIDNYNVVFQDYPLLIRLNPNIPWKTRGNAAVCLRFELKIQNLKTFYKRITKFFDSIVKEGLPHSDPILIALEGEIPQVFAEIYMAALRYPLNPRYIYSQVSQYCSFIHYYRSIRGIVGGVSAIGSLLLEDHTYELIAYRKRENWGKPRKINTLSVLEMDKACSSQTFNNVDPETKRVLIAPHGPDPVLFGVRGESPSAVLKSLHFIKVEEPIDSWVIFRSNQGTGVHLPTHPVPISSLQLYQSVFIRGKITQKPQIYKGGHVFFELSDHSGEIKCAAYEPTGSFREVVLKLKEEDVVSCYGGVQQDRYSNSYILNLEKLEVNYLTRKYVRRPPLCVNCGIRMTSRGLHQGYICKKCGAISYAPDVVTVKRDLEPGIYLPPPRAHRHLSKPMKRYVFDSKKWRGFNPSFDWFHFPP
ncbi:hypothetical protein B6U74_00065 [Candidatus Bathyarchaeota archaeon ex4484_205]|nr:MAG: hypothetical protein B6U74_00065 [Candidatus Bathyarchaeota archaeon ex4484_205]